MREALRDMEYVIAGLISVALGVYLLYALLRPEKF
jgi:K+-transporting ATPase KdpF subunit